MPDEVTVLVFGNANTHHYFAVSLADPDVAAERDEAGRIAVYTDRMECMARGEAKLGRGNVGVIGMSDTKWAMFQIEVPHYLA